MLHSSASDTARQFRVVASCRYLGATKGSVAESSRNPTESGGHSPHCIQETGLGRFDLIRMNVERRPVTSALVLSGGNCKNTHFGMLAEDGVANSWPLSGFIQGNDH